MNRRVPEVHIVFSSNCIKKDISKKPGTPTSNYSITKLFMVSHTVSVFKEKSCRWLLSTTYRLGWGLGIR